MLKRILVGHVWVDSGRIVVGDPAYLAAPRSEEQGGKIYERLTGLDQPDASPLQAFEVRWTEGDHHYQAVTSESGPGDGIYPVYAILDSDDRVRKLEIDFYPDHNAAEINAALRGAVPDHRIPLSRGGRNDASNLVLTCESCNSRKGVKDPEAFQAEVERGLVVLTCERKRGTMMSMRIGSTDAAAGPGRWHSE